MATLSHALPFQGYPEEESTHVLVLDTNSQHPHKGTHPFTMSLQRMTVCTYTCGVVPAHPECIEGRCLRNRVSNTRLSTASGLCVCDGGRERGRQCPIMPYSPPVPVAAGMHHATVQGKSLGVCQLCSSEASEPPVRVLAPCSAETRLANGREMALWEDSTEP